jgi:predicted Zn-ribbon and HTH transcriptional regulator
MATSIISPIETGALYIHRTARSFLFVGILNTVFGIVLPIIGWPLGLFSLVVGSIELINASLFWSTPPKRKSAPMYVAVLEIINIISLGTLWSPILGIINVTRLKSQEVQAFFAALQRGEILPNDRGLSQTTGQFKKCLKCAELIQMDAIVCRYCGYQFNEDDVKRAKDLVISRANKLAEQALSTKLQKESKNQLFSGWLLVLIGGLFFISFVFAYLFPAPESLSQGTKMTIVGLIGGIIIFVVPFILWGLYLLRKAKRNKIKIQSDKKEKVYKSIDNVGTAYTDHRKVDSAWQAQGMFVGKGNKVDLNVVSEDKVVNKEVISKGSPFICYTFTTEETARNGLSSLSFIKIASDTNEFISLETLEFGCYDSGTNGLWEVIIWGDSFTSEMFEESNTKLSAAGGNKKGERKPVENTRSKTKVSNLDGKTTYVRKDVKGPNTYEIYKAPSKSVALEFLKMKPVTKSLYYVIVETPEGNWGKDIDGIYQE